MARRGREEAVKLDPETLDRLEALAREATPGPWLLGQDEYNPELVTAGRDESGAWIYVAGDWEERDSAFIAAVSPDVVLALIEVVREHDALCAERDELLLILAAERGDPAGALPGWGLGNWGPAKLVWTSDAGDHVIRRSEGLCWNWELSSPGWGYGTAPTAREAMRAVEAALRDRKEEEEP